MKTAVFLYNPESGKGKIARNVGCISTIFQAYGYDVTPQRIDFAVNPFDGNETIDLMVVAGGDGTVNYAVNAMKRKGLDIPIGVIPAGTANDFAGALGMSREPLEAARQIASGSGGAGRLRAGERPVLRQCLFSFGIFTTTSQRTPDDRKHRLGKLAYIIEGVREIAHDPRRAAGARGRRRAVRPAVAHGARSSTARRPAGSAWRAAPRSRDGLLDCILLEKRTFLRSALAMGRYLAGRQPEDRPPPPGPAARHPFDGRRAHRRRRARRGADFPLHIECLPGRPARRLPAVRGETVRRGVRCAVRFCLRTERLPGVSRVLRAPEISRRTGPFRLRNFWISGRILLFLSAKPRYMAENGKTATATSGSGREGLRKVSISRIKKEMSDVFYLSDDLVITSTLGRQNNTTADYPASDRRLYGHHYDDGRGHRVDRHAELPCIRPNAIVFFNPDSASSARSSARRTPRPTSWPSRSRSSTRSRSTSRPRCRSTCASARPPCWRSRRRTWTRSGSCSS